MYLLVVTPQTGFGASLRNGLDANRYDVSVTADFSEAILHVRKTDCPVIILDAELEDVGLSLLDIGYALRQVKSDVQFILARRAGQTLDEGLMLNPAVTLDKPISIPELTRHLEKLTPSSTRGVPMPTMKPSLPTIESQARALAETSRMVWIKDVSKAAQHLTRLTLESSAQAALITRESELWAYAGQLSREAAQELSESVQRYWDKESESDILRFIRLQSTEAQHILYARKLSASMILALVFDGETSFSTIRSQAGKLVRNLAEEPGELPATPPVSQSPFKENSFLLPDEFEEEDLPPISDLLGDVPPPIPVKLHGPQPHPASLPWEQPAESVPVARLAVDEPKTEPPSTLQPTPSLVPQFSLESSPVVRRDSFKRPIPAMDETTATNLPLTEAQAEARPSTVSDELQLTRKQVSQKDQSLIETRPHTVAESVTQVAHRILLEPASPAMADLTYACLLVPRFDTHHLVGDAADRLTEWVPQVCVAFGWRLEHLSVRPDYLQWVARVPPSTAPGHVMRVVRQQTSDRLFNEFPRFKKDNPSGDFWAPGYLIMGSSQPHPQHLVRSFIKQTRERQGLTQDE